jgi:signal transduction histidine kinase/DNA-binding response OmpR family regulator
MSSVPRRGLVKAVKGKIIFALLLGCLALFLAWGVSKVAFQEMLVTVENISAPSERLRLVNALSRKISSLDQLQKKQAFDDPGNYKKLFKESGQLRLLLDSLGNLYSADSLQLERIGTLKALLRERDKQFISYLKVREKLINNKAFSGQVKKLNELVTRGAEQTDSTILATEEKTSTTTVYPNEEKPKGFFSKLFGKKKTDEQNNSFKIVNEEKVKRDTIALSAEARMTRNLEKSLKTIEQEQRLKNAKFLNTETILTDANNVLISQMLDVLRKVESEVVAQIELNGIQAKKVVNTGITTIGIIMLVFFFLTVLLVYFIFTDITRSNKYRNELELARDEAEYHGRAKQRFLSNMSHEIRTPLQSIIGYAEIIKEQEHPQRKDIEAIYHSSEHLLQIVNEVLDYNRIISGKFSFYNKAFDLKALLDEVTAVMRPQASAKKLELLTDFELDDITYISGDPFRLKQILYNLLGNAIKFTAKGQVLLSVFYKRQGSQLHFTFTVKDTGIGMTEKESSLIFNEFEQVNSPDFEVSNKSGAGLGLTIVKALTESQGGRIYVKSKVGEGSLFTVYLTFEIAESPAMVQPVSKPQYNQQDQVWIVDDDQLILDLCGIILEKNGINYTCFNSPSQLLNAKWEDEVKIVLMDMRMPEMSGIELCKSLRERVGNKVKIFAITAQVLPDERDFLLDNGFDGLLMKPFKEEGLLSIFHEIIGTRTETASNNEAIELDLSALKKMTFGDEEQLAKILHTFARDCNDDAKEIKAALATGELDTLKLLTHRLAGRLAQIGAPKLASEYRLMELDLRGYSELQPNAQEKILTLLEKLHQLLALIKKR